MGLPEDLKRFYHQQLEKWPLAASNVEALSNIQKKSFKAYDLKGFIQYNPARAVSTLAKVDNSSVAKRPCFLCKENRPKEQKVVNIEEGWELLVNPFPILPYHFTIASTSHTPQEFSLREGMTLADKLPGMVVFFNSRGAGASAPDHLHYQAVPIEYLPLIQLMSKNHDDERKETVLPYKIYSSVEDYDSVERPSNVFLWRDGKYIKLIIIPRRAHRPAEYYLDAPQRRAVSPGAIDMAGVIVTPNKEDFDVMNDKDIINIYSQVAFTV